MDCGPTCLRIIAKYYGKSFSISYLREKCYIDKAGVSLKGIAEAAETIGFRAMAVKIPMENSNNKPSLKQAPLPVIVHWNQNHFVVVYKITKSRVFISDPSSGKFKLTYKEFISSYQSHEGKGNP